MLMNFIEFNREQE